MLPIDSGILNVSTRKMNSIVIEYKISFRRMFVIVGILSLWIYSISESFLTGLVSFLWLGGMNWLIGVVRHRFLFRNMISEIEYWE